MGWVKVADELPKEGRWVWVWWDKSGKGMLSVNLMHGRLEELSNAVARQWLRDRELNWTRRWIACQHECEGRVYWIYLGGQIIVDAPTHWHERWPEGLPERNGE